MSQSAAVSWAVDEEEIQKQSTKHLKVSLKNLMDNPLNEKWYYALGWIICLIVLIQQLC